MAAGEEMDKEYPGGLRLRLVIAAILIVFVTGAAGIYASHAVSAAAPATTPSAPMPVTVSLVETSDTPIWTQYSGRLDAVDYVEIRPQVSGTIYDILFQDGQTVKKGDTLYVIDPGPYEAAVAQAQADLATAKSQSDFTQKQLKRAQDLMSTNAISKDLLDERKNASSAAKNAVAAAEAKLKQAKIDLDHAYVKAPISGRVGRAEITKGNLVQAGPNAPLLTTILSNNEIYADFDVDEETYLRNVRNAGTGKGIATEQTIPVMLTVRGDEAVVYKGNIYSFDNRINTETGTIRARALFKNEDGALLPGMFVTVKMGSAGEGKNILVPEKAIGTDQDRKFVYIVGDDNKVQYREVKLGPAVEDKHVILSGVNPGEKIITEGLIRIRPDMEVTPQLEQDTSPPARMLVPPEQQAGK